MTVGTRPDWSPPPPANDTFVGAVVNGLKAALGKAGSLTLAGLSEAVEAPARALTRRAAETAVAAPRPLADEAALARALAERPGPPASAAPPPPRWRPGWPAGSGS